MSELRQRHRGRNIAQIVQQLDSFPKMPKDYKKTTGTGGLISLFTALFMMWLVLSEIIYYKESRIYHNFIPDVDYNDKLKINLDMTIAMPCSEIGADIIDVTNQESNKFGSFKTQDTWFELCPVQMHYFDELHRLNTYLKERYHSLRNILWRAGYSSSYSEMPERSVPLSRPYDACRFHGQLELNKVTGNLHFTAGKSIRMGEGHVHITSMFGSENTNFTHRINQFSFGDLAPGMMHPLDSSIKTIEPDESFQYFIEVVATDIITSDLNIKTYQYSVYEHLKSTSRKPMSSQGINGIFFKYDVNPLKIVIKEEEYPFPQLILRIFGCATGLYIVADLVHKLVDTFLARKYSRFGASSDSSSGTA